MLQRKFTVGIHLRVSFYIVLEFPKTWPLKQTFEPFILYFTKLLILKLL